MQVVGWVIGGGCGCGQMMGLELLKEKLVSEREYFKK